MDARFLAPEVPAVKDGSTRRRTHHGERRRDVTKTADEVVGRDLDAGPVRVPEVREGFAFELRWTLGSDGDRTAARENAADWMAEHPS
jgi:hypothetical protein